MKELTVNFSEQVGNIKPMHAVNNGPVYGFEASLDNRITNMDAYKAAGIPYARTHDASYETAYGGEHIIDVNMIFTDFSKDPYDPESYDFVLTDEYIKVIDFAGTKVFYRLGSKIEHWKKKYNTLPPADFHKWAVICEHIIRHYTEGWADGFYYDMEYWEIWNEPDEDPDSTNRCNWGGTEQQFFELYDITAKHLKTCFPHLKIGGPALAHQFEWAERFLAQLKAPLDFFSWHAYGVRPERMAEKAEMMRNMLDRYGFTKTENILDEWNYVKGWTGDDWLYSLKTEKSMKGAAFIAAVMSVCQKSSLDMLMYYDARPCCMNGMFCTDYVCECLKGYYPFLAFNHLYQLGIEYKSQGADELYISAAKKDDKAYIMVTRYTDNDEAESEYVKINISGVGYPVKAKYYLLDETHDLELAREEIFSGECFSPILKFEKCMMYLIELDKEVI